MSNEDLGLVAAVVLAVALNVLGFRVLRAVVLEDGPEWFVSQHRAQVLPLIERGFSFPPEDVQ